MSFHDRQEEPSFLNSQHFESLIMPAAHHTGKLKLNTDSATRCGKKWDCWAVQEVLYTYYHRHKRFLVGTLGNENQTFSWWWMALSKTLKKKRISVQNRRSAISLQGVVAEVTEAIFQIGVPFFWSRKHSKVLLSLSDMNRCPYVEKCPLFRESFIERFRCIGMCWQAYMYHSYTTSTLKISFCEFEPHCMRIFLTWSHGLTCFPLKVICQQDHLQSDVIPLCEVE